MGMLFYGGIGDPIEIEDRVLAHLKVVITTKMRRGESFTVSWTHPDAPVRGRSTIWIHPAVPMRFEFDDPEPAQLNARWLEELATSAHSTGGIRLLAEHIDGTAFGEDEAEPR